MVMEEEPPGRHELKAQFVELRASGLSYARIAKKLKETNIRETGKKQ
jgi:hypothetical protein